MKKLFKLLLIVVGFSLAALAQADMVKASTDRLNKLRPPYKVHHCEWALRLCEYSDGMPALGQWEEGPGPGN